MKNKIIKYFYPLIISLFAVLLSSCSSCDQNEEISIHYKNGTLFCNGKHNIEQKLFSKEKYRVGYWNFFYPNGKLESKIYYDNDGSMKTYEGFNHAGNLNEKYRAYPDSEFVYYYNPNGNLDKKIIKKFDSDDEDPDVYGEVYEYYPDGKLYSIRHFVNDKNDGICKTFDESGNIILELNYEEGIISNQNL